jgi:hypothetical protein
VEQLRPMPKTQPLQKLARINFRNSEIQPLAFSVTQADAGIFNFWNYSHEFVELIERLRRAC